MGEKSLLRRKRKKTFKPTRFFFSYTKLHFLHNSCSCSKKEFRYMYEGQSSHEVTRRLMRFACCVFDTSGLIHFINRRLNYLSICETYNLLSIRENAKTSRWVHDENFNWISVTPLFVGNLRLASEATITNSIHLYRRTRFNFISSFTSKKKPHFFNFYCSFNRI